MQKPQEEGGRETEKENERGKDEHDTREGENEGKEKERFKTEGNKTGIAGMGGERKEEGEEKDEKETGTPLWGASQPLPA